jgi:hypothetical protein
MKIEESLLVQPSERRESREFTDNLLRGRLFGFDIIICGNSVEKALSRIEKMLNRLFLLLLILLMLSLGFNEQAEILLKLLVGMF